MSSTVLLTCLFLSSIKYADAGPSSTVNLTYKTGFSMSEIYRENIDKYRNKPAHTSWVRLVDFQPYRALSLKNLVELAGAGGGGCSGLSLVILVTQFYQFTQEFSRSDESIHFNQTTD